MRTLSRIFETRIVHILKLSFFLLLGLWLLLGLTPKPPLFNRAGFSQAIFDRDKNLLRLTLSNDDKYRLWIPIDRIPKNIIDATLAQEDRHFYYHYGVNPIAIARAAFNTYVRHQTMGASTISMQVARMRFGLSTRTTLGKIEQMARAIQIERHYTKNEILEAYLNLAPYGGNVEGIGAASWVFLGKDISKVSRPEAITLAVLPQSPTRRNPSRKDGVEALRSAKNRLASHVGDGEGNSGLELHFGSKNDLPFLAPHLVTRVTEIDSRAPEIMTTLDNRMQKLVQREIALFVDRNKSLGMNNAVSLVVDSRNMEVMGYVGSSDFFNTEIAGQVNGILGRRSPGSALKPFIYALSMDQGAITPDTMLKDTALTISAYNPENYDRDFLGPISATDALIRSRNVPAIQLANGLRRPSLYDFLKSAGIPLREEGFYGLALALGGAEVSMEDLVKLYAMLVNGGVLRELKFQVGEKEKSAKSVLSPESSFLTLEMLKKNPRPHEDMGASPIRELSIPWKTGTSFGFRDAWAIGVVGPYVLGVWVGNFDGTPNPNFIGRDAAGPLFFGIADAVRNEFNLSDFASHSALNIKKVKVCALTGLLPSAYCHHLKDGYFIPGKSPIKLCAVHREVLVDSRTGLRTCNESAATNKEIFEFWPSDILKVFAQAGIHTRTPPPFEEDCRKVSQRGIPPLISSPQKSLIYEISEASSITPRNQVPFSAVTDGDSQKVYWFVNNDFVGQTSSGETFYWDGVPGEYTVGAVDDHGRTNTQRLRVSNRASN